MGWKCLAENLIKCDARHQGGTDFGAVQRKHLTITGSTLRSRTIDQKAAIVAALREKVWPLWAEEIAHMYL